MKIRDRYDIRLLGIFATITLLGSHILYGHQLPFILLALLFVDWKKTNSIEMGILILSVIALYGVYTKEHMAMFNDLNWSLSVVGELTMILLFYLLGSSIVTDKNRNDLDDRDIFYLLYGFFILYVIGIVFSYYYYSENEILSRLGYRVYYATKGLHFHTDGKIAVTIVSYLSSPIIVLLPMVVLSFKSFRDRSFSYFEILLLITIGVISLWISIGTGRRLAIFLIIIVFLWMASQLLYYIHRRYSWHYIFIAILLAGVLIYTGYYFLQNTDAIIRIKSHHGFTDQRSRWWHKGLQHMWQYPFGGADHMPIGKAYETKAHNTWIDIGKSYGIFAFSFLVLFYLMHIRYLYRIMKSKRVSLFMKNIIIILSFVLFFNMMIEHIFDSSKEFIIYSIFFLGFLKSYSDFVVDGNKSIAIH